MAGTTTSLPFQSFSSFPTNAEMPINFHPQQQQHENNSDDDMFLELPLKKAKQTRYPPGCRVLTYCHNSNNNGGSSSSNLSVQYGMVQSVGIDLDSEGRENLYKIQLQQQSPSGRNQNQPEFRLCQEHELQLAPFMPVWLQLVPPSDNNNNNRNSSPEKFQPAWIVSSEHPTTFDNSNVIYTISTVLEDRSTPATMTDISRDRLTARLDDNKPSTTRSTTSRRVVKPSATQPVTQALVSDMSTPTKIGNHHAPHKSNGTNSTMALLTPPNKSQSSQQMSTTNDRSDPTHFKVKMELQSPIAISVEGKISSKNTTASYSKEWTVDPSNRKAAPILVCDASSGVAFSTTISRKSATTNVAREDEEDEEDEEGLVMVADINKGTSPVAVHTDSRTTQPEVLTVPYRHLSPLPAKRGYATAAPRRSPPSVFQTDKKGKTR